MLINLKAINLFPFSLAVHKALMVIVESKILNGATTKRNSIRGSMIIELGRKKRYVRNSWRTKILFLNNSTVNTFIKSKNSNLVLTTLEK